MSLVGTRPPTLDEWEQYEPHHRAILLNGQEPIEVELRKLPEKHIEFASLDLDAHGIVTTAAEIQDCHNPYDSFALHKVGAPVSKECIELKKILEECNSVCVHIRRGDYLKKQLYCVCDEEYFDEAITSL